MGSKVPTRAKHATDNVKTDFTEDSPLARPAKDADGEPICNRSDNVPFATILHRRLSRRNVLRGGVVAAAGYVLGMPILNYVEARAGRNSVRAHVTPGEQLGFESIPVSLEDAVKVPPGYKVQVFAPWGTPINGASPMFDEINASNSAAEQAMQAGDHHDGMYYFPVPKGYEGSDHGICVSTTRTSRSNTCTRTAPRSTRTATAW